MSHQWPDFEKALTGLANDRQLSFQLDAIEVEDNPAIALPRSSKIQISAPLEPNDASVRFGWNATLGPLVLRQQSQTEKPENLYTAYLEPGAISAPIKRQGVTAQPVLTIILDYAKIGFVHIVPKGLDHILFVLGLFFYAARWRPLLGQVTLFTLAHTTTLMLASTGHIVVSPNLVEPLIAASIIYVAFENLRSKRLHAGRLVVIFAFGLLHGLGFASVLGDIGLADAVSHQAANHAGNSPCPDGGECCDAAQRRCLGFRQGGAEGDCRCQPDPCPHGVELPHMAEISRISQPHSPVCPGGHNDPRVKLRRDAMIGTKRSRKAQKAESDGESIPGGVRYFEARRFGSIFGILWGVIFHQKSKNDTPKSIPKSMPKNIRKSMPTYLEKD